MLTKLLILSTMTLYAMAGDDPPSQAARLSYLTGTVSFQPRGQETGWAVADLNRPLSTGDKIWVEQSGRAEIQTVNSTIRLNGRTSFSFLSLEQDTTQMKLSLGSITIRLHALDDRETYEIDTPQVAFTLLREGTYRIEVNEAGDATTISVRSGDGETTAGGTTAVMHTNEQVVIKGTPATYVKHPLPNPDEFDTWAADRDAKAENSVSVKAVAPGVVGAADLDTTGYWKPAPTYGNVWFPNSLPADWAPYRFGHWTFVAPWGWTWIDDAPWGYAPFHYGRWVMVGGHWGWAPGPVAVKAVYAPALVSFISGIEGDTVGWVALSWGEPWYPNFAVSFGYYNTVNLSGSIFAPGIIAGVWSGAPVNLSFGHNPAAVSVTSRANFEAGHSVGRVSLDSHALDHAAPSRTGARGIGATREAQFGGHPVLKPGARGLPPHSAINRSVVTRHKQQPARGGSSPARHGAPSVRGGAPASHGNPGGASKGSTPPRPGRPAGTAGRAPTKSSPGDKP